VNRALMVLTCGAFLTLVLEAGAEADPLPGLILGAIFTLVATAGFAWVRRPGRRHQRVLGACYIAVLLALGFALHAAGFAGVGATLLLVVLVSQGVLLLPLPAAVLVTAIVPLVHVGMAPAEGLRIGIGTLVAVVFGAVITALLERERLARAELADAHARLRGYAAQAEELATTQERNRVARDIHDGLGHYLTVVQMQVKAARAVLESDPARADAVLAKAPEQASEALAEVRRSVGALRGPRTSPPLPEALKALAAETSAAGVPTELDVTGPVRELPAATEEALYRMAQEGLTNVRKHARATHAHLTVDYGQDGTVGLRVRDDGAGLAEGAETAGFGLVGLRERAERLGGRVVVDSAPGQGVTLDIEVPG
jgi:signal transduction histidine kinase